MLHLGKIWGRLICRHRKFYTSLRLIFTASNYKLCMSNITKYLCIFFLSVLMACTAQYTWTNPQRPSANYATDEYECTSLANRTVPVFDSSNYVPPPAINEGPRVNLGCNNPGVSSVNCFSSTPQSVIPLSDNQLLGKTSYERFVDQCLHERGWQKIKVVN